MTQLLDKFLKNPALSTYRERLIEHIFIADIVQAAMSCGNVLMVSRSEIDVWGYDVVLSCSGISRAIQLKSSRKGSVKISLSLADIPGSCVVRAIPIIESNTSRISLNYKVFENGPKRGLSLKGFARARATRWIKTTNGEVKRKLRMQHVAVPQSAFSRSLNAEKLFQILFPGS